jgi:hypothetical protein
MVGVRVQRPRGEQWCEYQHVRGQLNLPHCRKGPSDAGTPVRPGPDKDAIQSAARCLRYEAIQQYYAGFQHKEVALRFAAMPSEAIATYAGARAAAGTAGRRAADGSGAKAARRASPQPDDARPTTSGC